MDALGTGKSAGGLRADFRAQSGPILPAAGDEDRRTGLQTPPLGEQHQHRHVDGRSFGQDRLRRRQVADAVQSRQRLPGGHRRRKSNITSHHITSELLNMIKNGLKNMLLCSKNSEICSKKNKLWP